MASLQGASSFSAAFQTSQSISARQSTDSDGSKSTQLVSSRRIEFEASKSSNVLAEGKNGNTLNISTEAQLSFEFSKTTRLAVHQQGQSPEFGSRRLSDSENAVEAPSKNSKSLFEKDSLAQQIFEDNMKLFDNFTQQNGGKATTENVKKFVDLMKGSIPKSFGQAKNKLSNLNALSDADRDILNESKQAVMDKLENFQKKMTDAINSDGPRNLTEQSFSDLPGVEKTNKGLRVGERTRLSVKLTRMTQVSVTRQTRARTSEPQNQAESASNSAEAKNKADNSNQDSELSINVPSMTDSIFKDARSILNNFFDQKQQSPMESMFDQLSEIMEKAFSDGVDDAKSELSEKSELNSDDEKKLEEVKSELSEKADKLSKPVIQESDSKSSENTDTPEKPPGTGRPEAFEQLNPTPF